jgi:predicted esterase
VQLATASTADAIAAPTANPVASVVLTVLSWLGWSPRAEAAAQFPTDPTPWAVLDWLRVVHPWFNTAPTATVAAGPPDPDAASGQVLATDLQSDTLTYSVSRGPRYGTVVIDSATGIFTYTATDATALADSFAVTVDDGHRAGSTVVAISVDLAGTPVARKVVAARGHSNLALPCGNGCVVGTDWYFPDSDEPVNGIIWLQHGFGANAALYDRLAMALAEQTNSIVVAPSLPWLPLTGDGRWLNGSTTQHAIADLLANRAPLQASADLAAGHAVLLPDNIVLTGHSAGGGLAATVAGYLVDNGTAANLLGVVMFDGVPTGNAISTALAKLTGPSAKPVLQIASHPYAWNANGAGTAQLTAARPDDFTGVQLLGGSHIDSMQTSDLLISALAPLLVGYAPAENQLAVQTLAIGWILDMYYGTHSGIYGEHGESIAVGDATAVVL